MFDFYEVEFLEVNSRKSGDAIIVRYNSGDSVQIHIVDGGFQNTGQTICEHLKKFYGDPTYIHRVIASHPDGDHTGGLRTILENYEIGELWMLRPWIYAHEIIGRFQRYSSVDNLKKRLKEIYYNLAELEDIALKRGIDIFEPFQGRYIGNFLVLAPTKSRYLDLIVQSEKTPESIEAYKGTMMGYLLDALERTASYVRNMVNAAWGEEIFSSRETSAENEMSVVQYSKLCDHQILLTADAGRSGLLEASLFYKCIFRRTTTDIAFSSTSSWFPTKCVLKDFQFMVGSKIAISS
jgi:hypothetical protein